MPFRLIRSMFAGLLNYQTRRPISTLYGLKYIYALLDNPKSEDNINKGVFMFFPRSHHVIRPPLRRLFLSSVLVWLCLVTGTLQAQNFLNYPDPALHQPSTESANGQNNEEPSLSSDSFDASTGTLSSNIRLKRKIHDQIDVRKHVENVYQNWLKLSMLGRDQNEIENYFREIPEDIILEIKGRLRNRIMRNLELAGISRYTSGSLDIRDIKIALRLIDRESKKMGMEYDLPLKSMIKQKYGFSSFLLDQLAYMIR